MKKKLNLNKLQVKSFITKIDQKNADTVNGGLIWHNTSNFGISAPLVMCSGDDSEINLSNCCPVMH